MMSSFWTVSVASFRYPYDNFCVGTASERPSGWPPSNSIHGLNQDWVGAAFEFHDATVQSTFAEVRRTAGRFCELVLERIYATHGNPEIGSPRTDEDLARGVQPGTLQAIREMNERATELSEAIDNFDRTARDRIRIASGAHAAEVDDRGTAN